MSDKCAIGEVAKKLQISTRTLRFYDQKGLIKPIKDESNGYRFYDEKQIAQLQLILYLKELGFSLNKIKMLLEDSHGLESLILLVKAQTNDTNEEIQKLKIQRKQLQNLQEFLSKQNKFELADLTKIMTKENSLKNLRRKTLGYGVLLDVIEVLGIILAFYFGRQDNTIATVSTVVLMLLIVLCGAFLLSRKYYRYVAYVCPHCGKSFIPSFRQFMLSAHTPKMRRLRCPNCHEKAYCLEVSR